MELWSNGDMSPTGHGHVNCDPCLHYSMLMNLYDKYDKYDD